MTCGRGHSALVAPDGPGCAIDRDRVSDGFRHIIAGMLDCPKHGRSMATRCPYCPVPWRVRLAQAIRRLADWVSP